MFKPSQFSTIRTFLSKIPGFSKPEKSSLGFLNATQFLVALNDNIYKLVLIFFLIQIKGADQANTILALAGAIFVIPFLLFSSVAGILADRYSKSTLIIGVKAFEIVIMLFAVLAFAFHLTWSSYFLLFLLSTLAALFGPSKYGIIPEIVPKDRVSKANGLITSFTYLAIISGTFLASFLTEITNHNYVLVGGICLFFSLVGFATSLGIKHTPPKGSTQKVNFRFVTQIVKTLVETRKEKHLLLSLCGAAFFLFIGGYTQLNIIPFAIESLKLSEVAGGYLFLVTALGIAFGAFIAGRASKQRVELALPCLAGLFIALLFFLLSISHSLIPTVIFLFAIGFFGGNFIVPFDTFIQVFSPEATRGHTIAAGNFLSFVGVLLASVALYLFNQIFGLTSGGSFAVMGIITLLFSILLIFRLSDLFLSFTSKKILHFFYRVHTHNIELIRKASHPILMLEDGSFLKAWLLCGIVPNIHILVPQYKTRRFPWFQRVFYSIHRIETPHTFEELVFHGQKFADPEMIPCIYLLKKKPIPEKEYSAFRALFKRDKFEVILVNFEKNESGTTIHFSK
ncbi:MAG: MFS transporter [Verrucomicrobia bacterium]|nr:MFS transporter [Verrucomicrobiota bacterium]